MQLSLVISLSDVVDEGILITILTLPALRLCAGPRLEREIETIERYIYPVSPSQYREVDSEVISDKRVAREFAGPPAPVRPPQALVPVRAALPEVHHHHRERRRHEVDQEPPVRHVRSIRRRIVEEEVPPPAHLRRLRRRFVDDFDAPPPPSTGHRRVEHRRRHDVGSPMLPARDMPMRDIPFVDDPVPVSTYEFEVCVCVYMCVLLLCVHVFVYFLIHSLLQIRLPGWNGMYYCPQR